MTAFLIDRPVLVSMLLIGACLLGGVSYTRLPVELIPFAELPMLVVYVGSASEGDPHYLEQQAVIPLESAIASLEEIERIESYIQPRQATLFVYYAPSSRQQYAYLKLQERVDATRPQLGDAFQALVWKIDTEQLANQFMSLQARGSGSLDQIRHVVDQRVVRDLEQIDGVANVAVYGGRQRSIEVRLDEDLLRSHGLTISQVASRLSQSARPRRYLGKTVDQDRAYFVNLTTEYTSLDDLGQTVIEPNGSLRLEQLAAIVDGGAERETIARVNGMEAVTISLVRDRQANLLDLSRSTRRQVDRLNEALAIHGVELVVTGVGEVWRALSAATLTTVCVFLPFVFSENFLVRTLGRHVGVSIISTLLVSLAVAFLLIPVFAFRLLGNRAGQVDSFNVVSQRHRLMQIYTLLLKSCLRFPARTLGLTTVVFFLSILLCLVVSVNAPEEVELTSFDLYATFPAGATQERIVLRLDRPALAHFGISPAAIAAELAGFQPQVSSGARLKSGAEEIDVILESAPASERRVDDLRQLQIPTPAGGSVPLLQLAELTYAAGYGHIDRVNQEKQVELSYDFASEIRASNQLLDEARAAVDRLTAGLAIPPGVAVEVIHDELDLSEFYFLIAAAVVLIYMILTSVFESLVAPLSMMITLPLATIGAFWGLTLTGNSIFNANALIGFLILLGVVVNNGIMLIDYARLLQRRGFHLGRALLTAGQIRVRPILITALSTILAMFPLAMGKGEYVARIGAPFAITVIGGLIAGTLFTLVLAPTVYFGLFRTLSWLRALPWPLKVIQLVVLAGGWWLIHAHIDSTFWQFADATALLALIPALTHFARASSTRRNSTSTAFPDPSAARAKPSTGWSAGFPSSATGNLPSPPWTRSPWRSTAACSA